MSTRSNDQAVIKRRPNGTYAPGQSGCADRAKAYRERQRQIKAFEAEFLNAVVNDVGGKKKLTALELILAQQAASELAKARFEPDPALRVRLSRSATSIIDRIRDGVANRTQRPSLGAFAL